MSHSEEAHVAAKRLIVHCGTMKTGTSYIQHLFHHNSSTLEKFNINYPHLTPPDIHLPRFANGNFLLGVGAKCDSAPSLLKEGFSTIISEETLLLHVNKLGILNHLALPKVIVVYLRRPAELVASWAAEMAKPYNAFVDTFSSGAGPLEIHSSCENLLLTYKNALLSLVDFVSVSKGWKLVARPYDVERFQSNNIAADLIDQIGEDGSAVLGALGEAASYRANESVSRKYCDVSNVVWRYLGMPRSAEIYNDPLVQRVVGLARSGDERKVVDTLTDIQISEITCELTPEYQKIERVCGLTRPLFENLLTKNFGLTRKPYIPVDQDEVIAITNHILSAGQ